MEAPKTATIKRRPDWSARLIHGVEARRFRKFSWLDQNCCLFPADLILDMTGTDIAAGFRRKLTSAQAVRRIVKQFGDVANLAADVLPRYGFRSVAPALARRGDVVLTLTEQGYSGGICLGSNAAFPGPTGLVFLSLNAVSHAYTF